jgi:phage terminase large subunit-like protein
VGKVGPPAFGTIKSDGSRQYRFVYCEIPKKNGKTELAGRLPCICCVQIGKGKPEVYSASGDKEQAGLCFSAAAEMVKSSPILSKNLKILESRKRIVNPRNSGFYQVLSSESELQHGLSPSQYSLMSFMHSQQTAYGMY